MLADPNAFGRMLSELLNAAATAEQIERAVADSSFERMRQIEEADIRAKRVGIFYKPYLEETIKTGLRFMRAGRAGEAARMLSPQQRTRFVSAFGAIMGELGYSLEQVSPAMNE
jgi:hypothetical protein